MQARHESETLQLGDDILIETSVDEVPLVLRGKLSSLLPKVVWVNVGAPGVPPLVLELKEGHPVRLSAARACNALVGESTFRSCLGMSGRLVAFSRPLELKLVDRRSKLRVAIRKSIGLRLARSSTAGEGRHFSIGTSVEISTVGIRFDTALHMAVGDRVFVTVVLEQNRQLYSLAQIVRLDDAIAVAATDRRPQDDPRHDGRHLIRAAARWDAMAPADRERLEAFLLNLDRAASA